MGIREEIHLMLSEQRAADLIPIVELRGAPTSAEGVYIVPDPSSRGRSVGAGRIGVCCSHCGHAMDMFAFESNWFPMPGHPYRCINCGAKNIAWFNQPGEMYRVGSLDNKYMLTNVETADEVKFFVNRIFILHHILYCIRKSTSFIPGAETLDIQRRFEAFLEYNEITDVCTNLYDWAKNLNTGSLSAATTKAEIRRIIGDTHEFSPKCKHLLIGTEAHALKNYNSIGTKALYTIAHTTNDLLGSFMIFPVALLPLSVSNVLERIGMMAAGASVQKVRPTPVPPPPVFALYGTEVTCSRCGNIEEDIGCKKCTNCGFKYSIFKTTSALKRAIKAHQAKTRVASNEDNPVKKDAPWSSSKLPPVKKERDYDF